MTIDEFREYGYQMIDWITDYYKNINQLPVKSETKPGDIINQLPLFPPQESQPFPEIFNDFKNLILPGITHWQHPSFFAYFPANASYPSILGEILTAAIGAQCMSWQTSPAATELEERVMQWLAHMIGLPENFIGVIQDTASTATLCALLTAREKKSTYQINRFGFNSQTRYTVYCSSEAHSSIEKAVKIAGIGSENLHKIAVDKDYRLIPEAMEKTIKSDIEQGFCPLMVVAAIGTTGSTAIDPLASMAQICQKNKIWLHVDAAYAGTGLLLEENRWMIEGIESVDSFVFNPHKWMFTNFDVSAYFVQDKEALLNTFSILPEYLKTAEDKLVNNYRDWGIQLGRRFRALKLWFVIRSFGVKGLQEKIRNHIKWAQNLAKKMKKSGDFSVLAPVPLATICFHYKPPHLDNINQINDINEKLIFELNKTGKIFLTHTKINGIYALRLVVGQTYVTEKHIDEAWKLIQKAAKSLH